MLGNCWESINPNHVLRVVRVFQSPLDPLWCMRVRLDMPEAYTWAFTEGKAPLMHHLGKHMIKPHTCPHAGWWHAEGPLNG